MHWEVTMSLRAKDVHKATLKMECSARGLPVSGTKAELKKRIDSSNKKKSAPKKSAATTKKVKITVALK